MINLGMKMPKSPEARNYPTMVKDEAPKIEYRRVTFPGAILDGKAVSIGQKIVVEVRGVVKSVSDKEDWNPSGSLEIEIHEGEIETEAEEKSEEKQENSPKGTMLGEE